MYDYGVFTNHIPYGFQWDVRVEPYVQKLLLESCKYAETLSGRMFAIVTGEIWKLLLLADS